MRKEKDDKLLKEKSVKVKKNNQIKKNIKNEDGKINKKKENIFKRILKYFKGVGREFKRIRWTTKKDLFKYSAAAIALVLFFALYFYGIDWIALIVRSLAK